MFKAVIIGLVKRYSQHGVAKSCAALTYYTLFSFFPFMVLLGRILGRLSISDASLITGLSRVIPMEVLALGQRYLGTPTVTQSVWGTVVWSAVTLHLFIRNINTLLPSLEQGFGVINGRRGWVRFLISFGLALGNIVLIVSLLLLITISKNVLNWLSSWVPISAGFISLWEHGRFLILGVLAFGMLFALYAAAVGRSLKWRYVLPGTVFSSVAWVLISMCFSFYVSSLSHYSVVYGSLGAMIVLLLWLYLSLTIIIMGAECSGVMLEQRDVI